MTPASWALISTWNCSPCTLSPNLRACSVSLPLVARRTAPCGRVYAWRCHCSTETVSPSVLSTGCPLGRLQVLGGAQRISARVLDGTYCLRLLHQPAGSARQNANSFSAISRTDSALKQGGRAHRHPASPDGRWPVPRVWRSYARAMAHQMRVEVGSPPTIWRLVATAIVSCREGSLQSSASKPPK